VREIGWRIGMVVYDTYAWIEYLRGTEKGKKVRALLKYGRYTPSIVLAEIVRKYLRKGILINEVGKRLIFIETKTKVVYIDSDLALNLERLT